MVARNIDLESIEVQQFNQGQKNLNLQSPVVQKVSQGHQHESLSMDSLACTSNLRKLETQIIAEFPAINEKQDSVRIYNQIQQAIDKAAESNGELTVAKFDALIVTLKDHMTDLHTKNVERIHPDHPHREKELERFKVQFERRMKIIDEVNTLGSGMSKSGNKFSFDQRVRLIKNIENEIADINLQLNMDFQKMKKLSDQYHECMQVARSSIKTLHDLLVAMAKAIKG